MGLFRAVKKCFKQQADNEEQAALELASKAQVPQGRGIQGHFEIQSLGNRVSRGFRAVFSTANAMLFYRKTRKTGNNAVEMSQAFHNIVRFKRFTYLNLFKYAFNIIQNWEADALQFYSTVLIFCQQLWQKEMKVAGGFGRLPALIDSHGLLVAPPFFFFSFEIFQCWWIDRELTILLFIYFFIEFK